MSPSSVPERRQAQSIYCNIWIVSNDEGDGIKAGFAMGAVDAVSMGRGGGMAK